MGQMARIETVRRRRLSQPAILGGQGARVIVQQT